MRPSDGGAGRFPESRPAPSRSSSGFLHQSKVRAIYPHVVRLTCSTAEQTSASLRQDDFGQITRDHLEEDNERLNKQKTQDFPFGLFEGTEIHPIVRTVDIPKAVQTLLIEEANNPGNRHRTHPLRTEIQQVIADVGSPYNGGCVRRRDRPNHRLMKGGYCDRAVFLCVEQGGLAAREICWAFRIERGVASRVFSSRNTDVPVTIVDGLMVS